MWFDDDYETEYSHNGSLVPGSTKSWSGLRRATNILSPARLSRTNWIPKRSAIFGAATISHIHNWLCHSDYRNTRKEEMICKGHVSDFKWRTLEKDRGNRDVHADQETEMELDRTYTEERTWSHWKRCFGLETAREEEERETWTYVAKNCPQWGVRKREELQRS